MAIDWDYLLVETLSLAAVVFAAIYVENWLAKRKRQGEDRDSLLEVLKFVKTDLEKKLRFIDDMISFKDYKPFFTDMWDAVILGGKHTLMPFELFENFQHTYSWMKYFNSELNQGQKGVEEKQILKIIEEVRKSIKESIILLD